MATNQLKDFFTYGDHSFGLTIDPPIRDIEGSKGAANEIVHSIVNQLAAHSERIEECVNYALELDYRAYTVYVSGSVVELSRVDGAHSGYSIHLSIFPRVAARDNEAVGRLAKRDGYSDQSPV